MKRKIFTLFIAVATILVTFISYKIVYTYAEGHYFDKLFYRKSTKYGYRFDNQNYQNTVNKELKNRIADILLITNNHQYNKSKVLGLTSEKVYKIAILGDSFVYGAGIRTEERFSNILENLLNQHRPSRIYTLGIPGDGILDNLAKYELARNKINPDLVIYAFVNNDFSIDGVDRYPNEELLYDEILQKCPGETFMFNWDTYDVNWSWDELFLTVFFPAATEKYNNVCIFSESISLMNAQNIIFFPMNKLPKKNIALPNSYENISKESYLKHEWLMQKFKNYIEKQGGFILNYDYSDIPENLLRVSEKEGHYSAYTNRRIAEEIYKEIISNPRWKFTKDE